MAKGPNLLQHEHKTQYLRATRGITVVTADTAPGDLGPRAYLAVDDDAGLVSGVKVHAAVDGSTAEMFYGAVAFRMEAARCFGCGATLLLKPNDARALAQALVSAAEGAERLEAAHRTRQST